MIAIYSKIALPVLQYRFSMPRSLQYIKELAAAGIDWRELHLIDLTSFIYSLRIDYANQKLQHDRKKRLSERGITEVRPATQADFDAL